jgi:hypothetical protein
MASFSSMITRVQGLVGSHSLATTAVVGTFVNSRHDELLHMHEWHRRKSEVHLYSATEYTTGTVTLTNGAATITGASTVWTSAMTGWYLRIDDSLYIFTYVSGTSGTLADYQGNALVYPGATEADQTYVLFKRWYSLGTAIEDVISVQHQSRVTEVDQEYLDQLDPRRQATGTPSRFAKGVRDLPTAGTDKLYIEVHPRPSSALTMTAFVMKGHTDLATTSTPIVPSSPVEWFAAVDSCLFLFAKTKEQKWLDLAVVYEKKGQASFEMVKIEDAKQFSRSPKIKDVGGGNGLVGSDWSVSHDDLFF